VGSGLSMTLKDPWPPGRHVPPRRRVARRRRVPRHGSRRAPRLRGIGLAATAQVIRRLRGIGLAATAQVIRRLRGVTLAVTAVLR
jgi:hypothetical protein